MKISVDVKNNFPEIIRASGIQINQAMKDMCEAYVKNAQANVPVDTGALRDSITYDVDGTQAAVGSDLEYAASVELRDIGHRVGKAHYLRDAGQDNIEEYKEILQRDLKG